MLPKIITESRKLRKALKQPGQQSTGATGCICPPTSERTCTNPTCPRQDHRTLGEKLRGANQ